MRRAFTIGVSLSLMAASAFAGGATMPWNQGLTAVSNNVTGPTALALTTIGGAMTVAPMIFHGEMPHFANRMSHWALAGGALLAIPTVVSFFGIGGALIGG